MYCLLQYSRVALLVKDKSTLGEDKLAELTELIGDEDKAKEVCAWLGLAGTSGCTCSASR